MPGPVAVPPRPLLDVTRHDRQLDTVQPGHVSARVVRVTTSEPGVRRRAARLQATGPEQGGARLSAVSHQAVSRTVHRKCYRSPHCVLVSVVVIPETTSPDASL